MFKRIDGLDFEDFNGHFCSHRGEQSRPEIREFVFRCDSLSFSRVVSGAEGRPPSQTCGFASC